MEKRICAAFGYRQFVNFLKLLGIGDFAQPQEASMRPI